MSQILSTTIKDVYELLSDLMCDNRGFFLKTFTHSYFEANKLNTEWKEEYFSMSHINVLRGMHFQVPPYSVEKLVTCLSGSVLDVVVDLRSKSPTYLKVYSTILDSKSPKSIYIPKGCAHGFLSLAENSLLHYKVSEEYNPIHDKGILWSTIDYNWPILNGLIISDRDKFHPSLDSFDNPF